MESSVEPDHMAMSEAIRFGSVMFSQKDKLDPAGNKGLTEKASAVQKPIVLHN